MISFFEYNWQIRDEWLLNLADISDDELMEERTGGVGSILKTFFHIIDVEYSWIQAIEGKPDSSPNFNDYMSLLNIQKFSEDCKTENKAFIDSWSIKKDNTVVDISWTDGMYTQGEILRHVIAHEIYHIGQVSVWAKELQLKPVSANIIGRNINRNLV